MNQALSDRDEAGLCQTSTCDATLDALNVETSGTSPHFLSGRPRSDGRRIWTGRSHDTHFASLGAYRSTDGRSTRTDKFKFKFVTCSIRSP
jgi:hypothetical protein